MDHNYTITLFRVNRQNNEISHEKKIFRGKGDPYQWGKRPKQKQKKTQKNDNKKFLCVKQLVKRQKPKKYTVITNKNKLKTAHFFPNIFGNCKKRFQTHLTSHPKEIPSQKRCKTRANTFYYTPAHNSKNRLFPKNHQIQYSFNGSWISDKKQEHGENRKRLCDSRVDSNNLYTSRENSEIDCRFKHTSIL